MGGKKRSEPNFSNSFQMAAYNATGTLIDVCGLTCIAIDCELLASGSVNEVLSGKHFNRCKRVHTIMALGLQTLNFEAFLETFQKELPDFYQDIIRCM